MASRITTLFAAAGLAVALPIGLSAGASASVAGTAAQNSQTSQTSQAAVSAAGLLPAAGTGGPVTFGIQPVPHSNSDTRSAFAVSATPGARSSDSVRVSNFGDSPVTLHVYASDAVNTPEGGYDLKPSGTKPVDVGTWVAFTGGQGPYVTIPAKKTLDLPFTISVPAKATPGDHPGGIVAALTTPSLDSHGNRINIEQRVGTRIYVRVSGPLKAQLSVQQLGITYHNNWNPFGSGSATVSYKVTNTGNVRLSAKQAMHVSTLFGGTVSAPALKQSEQLLPGNSLDINVTVKGVMPAFMATAHVSVDPAPIPGDLDPQVVATSGSASTVAMPWEWLILLVLAAGFGFEVFRQRRKALRPSAPAAGAAKTAPPKGPKAPKAAAAASGGATKAQKADTLKTETQKADKSAKPEKKAVAVSAAAPSTGDSPEAEV